jgi:hypothetical protein
MCTTLGQVYNRPVLLTGMDDYTRRWYCARHSVGPGADALHPIEVGAAPGA